MGNVVEGIFGGGKPRAPDPPKPIAPAPQAKAKGAVAKKTQRDISRRRGRRAQDFAQASNFFEI